MFHVKQCTKAAAWAAGGSGGLRRQLSAPVGAASAASGFGGSFPLQSARLRLLRAPAAAFRFGRRGFGCFRLRWARVAAALRASAALRSWACSASVGGGQLRFASPPSAILRFAIPVATFASALIASAQPRRSALRCLRHCLPPLQAAASALRCLRHCLPTLQAAASAAAPCRPSCCLCALFHVKHLFCIVSRGTFCIVSRGTFCIVSRGTFSYIITDCYTWNIINC